MITGLMTSNDKNKPVRNTAKASYSTLPCRGPQNLPAPGADLRPLASSLARGSLDVCRLGIPKQRAARGARGYLGVQKGQVWALGYGRGSPARLGVAKWYCFTWDGYELVVVQALKSMLGVHWTSAGIPLRI